MERRKGIPLVALVIFIALLVAVILTCVIILSNNKNKNRSSQQIGEQPSPNTPVVTSTPKPSEETLIESITDEGQLNESEEVKKAFETVGNKKTFAKYAIYNSGGFDTDNNNLSNELKLTLALAQITNEDMDKDSSTKSVSKSIIENYAQKIFKESDDINYESVELFNNDQNFITNNRISGYIYDQETDKYKVREEDVTEEQPSTISEIIMRADIYENKIELYVRPLFLKTFIYQDEEGNEELAVSINYNYDFQIQDFKDNALNCLYSQYESELLSSYNRDIDGFIYKNISNVEQLDFNLLNEYKYTLYKEDGNYKIKSFELMTKESEKPEITELDEEQISAFNDEVEKFIEDESSLDSDKVKELLENIISLNENYIDNAKNVIGVSFTVNGETIQKVVSESDEKNAELVEEINSKIRDMIDNIDTDKSYIVKPTYKKGLITTVSITEE